MANGAIVLTKLMWGWAAGQNVGVYRKVVLEAQVHYRMYNKNIRSSAYEIRQH